jgi:hypothetical protein
MGGFFIYTGEKNILNKIYQNKKGCRGQPFCILIKHFIYLISFLINLPNALPASA